MRDGRICKDKNEINAYTRGTLMETLGITYLDAEDGRLRATMPVVPSNMTPDGLLHGGASISLAESLASTASWLLIDQKTHYMVGLDLHASHVRPAHGGKVTGKCVPVNLGRSIHVWDVAISDEADKLVSSSRVTIAIRERSN